MVHAAPLEPHASTEGELHADEAQHPSGHEEASQLHTPAAQRWPAWQGGLPPQEQAPSSEQVSASLGSHATQEVPRPPQLCGDCARQAPWKQQPDGQLVLSQAQVAPTQRCPVAQGPHAEPASGGSASATSMLTS